MSMTNAGRSLSGHGGGQGEKFFVEFEAGRPSGHDQDTKTLYGFGLGKLIPWQLEMKDLMNRTL